MPKIKPDAQYYTVEFYGPKGWEVGYEGTDGFRAQDYLMDCYMDDYDARLTVHHEKP